MADVLPFESDQAKSQFETWLPWYVNGTLDAQQKVWMDAYLTVNPVRDTEVAWLSQLQEVIQVIPAPPSTDLGLERTLRRIHGHRAENEQQSQRLQRWSLRRLFSVSRSSGFAWVASAIILCQSGFLLHYHLNLPSLSSVPVRSQPGETSSPGAVVIRLTFNADTREEDIRLTIAAVHGRIIGGPGRLGDYYITSELAAESAMSALRAKAFVESAIEVSNVPPRD